MNRALPAITAIAIAASFCSAQEEHVPSLAPLVGCWTFEGKWDDGTPIKGEESIQWCTGQEFLKAAGWYTNREGKQVNYRLVVGWDAKSNKIIESIVTSEGVVAHRVGHYDAQAKTWNARETSKDADGKEGSFDLVRQFGERQQVTSSAKNIRQHGRPQPGITIQYTRHSTATKMPDHVRQSLERALGKWVCKTRFGEKNLQAEFSAQWAPGKECLVWHSEGPGLMSFDTKIYSTGTLGWDHNRQLVKEVAFNSLGESFTTYWQVERDQWTGFRTGTIDGRQFSGQIQVKWQPGNDDRWEVLKPGWTMEGEKQEDVTTVVRRKQ